MKLPQYVVLRKKNTKLLTFDILYKHKEAVRDVVGAARKWCPNYEEFHKWE